MAELAALDAQARAAAAARLMDAGVMIFRPDTTVIDPDVEVGADTVIEPFVQLLGSTRIGAGADLFHFDQQSAADSRRVRRLPIGDGFDRAPPR